MCIIAVINICHLSKSLKSFKKKTVRDKLFLLQIKIREQLKEEGKS